MVHGWNGQRPKKSVGAAGSRFPVPSSHIPVSSLWTTDQPSQQLQILVFLHTDAMHMLAVRTYIHTYMHSGVYVLT